MLASQSSSQLVASSQQWIHWRHTIPCHSILGFTEGMRRIFCYTGDKQSLLSSHGGLLCFVWLWICRVMVSFGFMSVNDDVVDCFRASYWEGCLLFDKNLVSFCSDEGSIDPRGWRKWVPGKLYVDGCLSMAFDFGSDDERIWTCKPWWLEFRYAECGARATSTHRIIASFRLLRVNWRCSCMNWTSRYTPSAGVIFFWRYLVSLLQYFPQARCRHKYDSVFFARLGHRVYRATNCCDILMRLAHVWSQKGDVSLHGTRWTCKPSWNGRKWAVWWSKPPKSSIRLRLSCAHVWQTFMTNMHT